MRGHAPLNVGAERARIGELQRVPTGASQVKRFGHAALKTPSLAALAGWYSETLGPARLRRHLPRARPRSRSVASCAAIAATSRPITTRC